jgi:Zn-finger protein
MLTLLSSSSFCIFYPAIMESNDRILNSLGPRIASESDPRCRLCYWLHRKSLCKKDSNHISTINYENSARWYNNIEVISSHMSWHVQSQWVLRMHRVILCLFNLWALLLFGLPKGNNSTIIKCLGIWKIWRSSTNSFCCDVAVAQINYPSLKHTR